MCRTGCPTQDCGSYAKCLKNMNLRVAYCGIGGGDATTQKKWDGELQEYRDAVRQGIEPAGTRLHQTREAVRISNQTGTPYKAPN